MSPIALPTSTAAVLYGPSDIRIEDRTLWAPPPGHVQLAITTTGLCGSDLHYYAHGRNGDFAVRAPLVLGHEASGIVTAVGTGVVGVKVGQRVAVEAGIACRNCGYCERGRYNLCKGMRFCSSAARFPHVDGTLQTRMNHPAHVVHPLPDTVSFELAALAEPLSVLIHASRRCQLQPKQSVLVFGVGAIGLLACALSKHIGASRVVAVDINRQRLEWARENGFADEVFCLPPPVPTPPSGSSQSPSSQSSSSQSSSSQSNSLPPPDPLHTSSSLLTHFSAPDGFSTIFECTGAPSSIQSSIYLASPGGKVVLIGMGAKGGVVVDVGSAQKREVDVLGSFRYAGTYPEAIRLLSGAQTQTQTQSQNQASFGEMVQKLVTHRFKLRDAARAFELLRKGVDEKGGLVLKVMVGSGVAC